MRKILFFCLMLMASTLTIGLLAGCSEEVTVNNKNGDDRQLPVVCDGATVFVSGTDATRTKIDNNALFYWVKDDQIWVDENGDNQFLLRSDTSVLDKAKNNRFASFLFKNKNLSEPTYNLTYTGNGSTSGTKVTIKKQQVQMGDKNSEHIGRSGDCGVDSAKKVAGKYSFNLKHKAHYLIFQPYKDDFINGQLGVTDTWTLMSIDIIDTDGIPLSGTFSFGMDGLDQTQEIENANDSVTLKCGPNGFVLPEKVYKDDDAKKIVCYAVIAPAPKGGQERRNLKIRYNVKIKSNVMLINQYAFNWNPGNLHYYFGPSNPQDSLFYFRNHEIICRENGVSKFRHGLGKSTDFEVFSSNSFYTWDALGDEYSWKGDCDDPYPNGDPNTFPTFDPAFFGFNTRATVTTGWFIGTYEPYTHRRYRYERNYTSILDDSRSFNDVTWPDGGDNNFGPYQATRSCLSMPDVNAASWYVMAGDPRLDTEKNWCVNGNYRYIYTTGAWFKKWNEIPGKPEGSTPTNCSESYDGTDYRTTPMPNSPLPFAIRDNKTGAYANAKPATEYKKGPPSPSEIDKYFFLPALGFLGFNAYNSLFWSSASIHSGNYWLSSSYPSNPMVPYTANNQTWFYYPNWFAYYLGFNKDAVFLRSASRDAGRIAGQRKSAGGVLTTPTGENWFQ